MWLVGICGVVLAVLLFGLYRMRRVRQRRELEAHSIEPDALHELMAKDAEVLVFDVRQPLDLLAYSEIIPGAKRIPPKEILEQSASLPKDKDSVIYCTCVSEDTSRMILKKALELEFTRIKFLKGGLAAWKAKGYPVERYETPFRLDTAV
jgi:rhodanese-related sulfurtransferase